MIGLFGLEVALACASAIMGAVSGRSFNSVDDVKGAVKELSKQYELVTIGGSMTKLASKYIISPMIVVSDTLKHHQHIDKVVDLNMDIFSAFYMQAFDTLRTLYGKDVKTTIDIMSNTSGGSVGTMSGVISKFSKLSNQVSSEEYIDHVAKLFSSESLSLETGNTKETPNTVETLNNIKQVSSKDSGSFGFLFRNLNIKTTTKIEVNGKEETYTIEIPLVVRADIRIATPENIILVMKPNHSDKTYDMRRLAQKSGAIGLSELIFCGDLIKKYKEDAFKDTAGLREAINSRVISATNKISTMGAIGFEKYYQLYILDEADMVSIRKHLGGDPVKTASIKEKMLDQLYGMTVTILDNNWERGHIYIRDLPGESSFSFNSLGKRQDNKLDLSELFKAMLSNKPPQF